MLQILSSKPLFVTYKTDLGGTSLGELFEEGLKDDFNFFSFNELELKKIKNPILYMISYIKRILTLRSLVKKTSKNGHKIIFQNLKPALFSYGNWNSKNGIIISDFSHTLFDWYKNNTYKKNKRYYAQKFLYKKLYKILTFTDHLSRNLSEVYNVDQGKIFNVPLPLDFKNYYQTPREVNKIPKVLFVGGEFYRKGGNHLLDAWDNKLKGKCELTILTNNKIEFKKGIKVFNGVSKGTSEHISLFQSSDIFILPTDRDAYPIVLGEAAVASLAIITTRYALGAQNMIINGKSGFIAENPLGCIDYLMMLIENPKLILDFKRNAHNYIKTKFSDKLFKETILKAIQ